MGAPTAEDVGESRKEPRGLRWRTASGAFFVGGVLEEGSPPPSSTSDIELHSQPSGLPSGRSPKLRASEPRIPPSAALFMRAACASRLSPSNAAGPLAFSRSPVAKTQAAVGGYG